ncbi:hypothetical protein C5Z25_04320 [Lactobacillus sp. CBA3605]|uniref:WxL domain-containing protein n=1 Tax=Lactobacillus sp. CBA3605 TaxID=2099788 RepID=UPI000CFC96C6|nr:WxL domain-containing protein [Lactobacillus sp. CBA3605]AVK61032.1 hypothetical protein C5Z25_04320 [Lactobacillus sp. CBA3605]
MKKVTQQLALMSTILSLGSLLSTIPATAESAETTADVDLKQSATDNSIALDQAPTYQFKDLELSASRRDYTATAVNDHLIVRNPGVESGWQVTAKISDFKRLGNRQSDGANQLVGAQLTLMSGIVAPTEDDNPSVRPVTTNNIVLSDQDQAIMTAAKGAGLGTYQLEHINSQVKLSVPSGNRTGTYQAKITWTLGNAPTGA